MVSINLDITLVIQIVNFIIALIVLNFVLIRPIRGILKQRRDLVDGMIADAGKFNEDAASRLKRYEAELDAARALAAEQRDAVRQQGVQTEQAILEEAQNEAQSFLQKSRKEVAQESEDAIRELRGKVNRFAGNVLAKVLE